MLEPKPVFDPVLASVDVSPARAAAINDYNDAMLEVARTGRAAVLSMDRYGGAAQANDLLWSSQQAAALNNFKSLLGYALVDAANKLDAYLAVLANEGVTTDQYTAQDFIDYQQRLQTTGFTLQEIADAKKLWFTDADIEAFKQEILADDPVKVAGDGIVLLTAESTAMRQLGIAINTPQNFSFQVSGSAGKTANAFVQPDRLARIFTNHSTFEIGNPLATTADIQLQVRRIGVPPDWGVSVSPVAGDPRGRRAADGRRRDHAGISGSSGDAAAHRRGGIRGYAAPRRRRHGCPRAERRAVPQGRRDGRRRAVGRGRRLHC